MNLKYIADMQRDMADLQDKVDKMLDDILLKIRADYGIKGVIESLCHAGMQDKLVLVIKNATRLSNEEARELVAKHWPEPEDIIDAYAEVLQRQHILRSIRR